MKITPCQIQQPAQWPYISKFDAIILASLLQALLKYNRSKESQSQGMLGSSHFVSHFLPTVIWF